MTGMTVTHNKISRRNDMQFTICKCRNERMMGVLKRKDKQKTP